VIGFWMLAGEPPFRGDSRPMLRDQHLSTPVPRLDQYRPDVPDWLRQILDRLLAKNPDERYQSADEVLFDMEQRRVATSRLPPLAKRECVSCGAETLATAAVCTACGYDTREVFQPGDTDVRCARATPADQLKQFVTGVFTANPRLPPR